MVKYTGICFKGSDTLAETEKSVVCLGYFDGVHLGHQALLRAGREKADALGVLLCVHTFDRAPRLKGMELTTLEQRQKWLRFYGADRVFVSTFDDALRRMSGHEFFTRIVLKEMAAVHVVCGDDHRFGYQGQCGPKELLSFCREAGIGCTVVPGVTLGGQRVSSQAIRAALREGRLADAERMLGHPAEPELLRGAERTEQSV